MKYLKEISYIIYLNISYEDMKLRLTNDMKNSSCKRRANPKDLKSMYIERTPLYQKFSDFTVDVSKLDIFNSLDLIVNAFN